MTSRNRLRRASDTPDGPDDAQVPGGAPPGPPPPEDLLVRVHDLAGRPRGTGFLADHHGTVITSHEAVDGLARLVLHAPGGRHCVVGADAVTPLPALDLALVRSEGLGLDPLPVTARDRIASGTYVTLAAGCWREARVLGATTVTYTATDRFHRLDDALELAIGTAGRDALRLGGGAAGGPVVDSATGAVLGVLGTALRSAHRDTGFAVPLRSPAPAGTDGTPGGPEDLPARARRPDGPLAALLAENATTVPAYGADLNLAGVLHLTATSAAQDGPPGLLTGDADAPGGVPRIERAGVTARFTAFEQGRAAVLGLVGAPGTGRTTELAAFAARRHRAGRPTLWLRGADLREDDACLAGAARRALDRAARIVAASRGPFPAGPDGLGDTGPERLADLSGTAGRPLVILLDGPEEMPPALAHRLAEWTDGTARWLRRTGIRLVLACRPEYWESAAARFPAGLLHPADDPADPADGTPACVRLGDLTAEEARLARARHGLPDGDLTGADARHPLALRLLAEVRAALGGSPGVRVHRDDLLAAHLDLMCLRVAVRLAAENGLRGTAVRRLAARVAGQVHEAARRSLGPGQGGLERAEFEELFPWGPAPAHLGGGTGWASAVLAEGLLVPAGTGYRFAHEEFADWIQGVHLDLDEALRALVHTRRTAGDGPDRVPVPHHRAGPVVEALLRLERHGGTGPLASRLADLVHALDADPGSWWAARLLTATLARVPDATPYTAVLGLLSHRIVAWRQQRRPVPAGLGPAFWSALALQPDTRFALLRRLVHADGPPCETGPRFLDAAARLLTADPVGTIPQLVRWFDDDRPLPATPHATVATAAQALLHTHRDRAPDTLTEALADSTHRRAGQLLGVLAEEEPAAVCRAVHRWARDERSARRAAAVTYGLRVVPYVRDGADRALLRHAALVLLDRSDDPAPHGGALALLVRDPSSRDRHLARALEHFAAGDPQLPPDALTGALITHPGPVLAAFGTRLGRADAAAAFQVLADATTPGLAGRVAALLRDAVRRRPELAGHLAGYADRRLNGGPAAQDVLFPLLTGLLDGGPAPLRAALAGILADPGTPASRPLRRVLLDTLLDREHDPDVLTAVLHAAARNTGGELRALVHRAGLLLARTPDGATRLDRALADLARHVPGFAAAVAGWLADAPREWAPLVGTNTRRTVEDVVGTSVPA